MAKKSILDLFKLNEEQNKEQPKDILDILADKPVSNIDFSGFSEYVDNLTELDRTIYDLETQLVELKKNRRDEVTNMVHLMEDNLINDITIKGVKYSIRSDIKCRIKKDRMPEAVNWLKEKGFDIAKYRVVFTGEYAFLKKFVFDYIRNKGDYDFEEEYIIHPMTLKAAFNRLLGFKESLNEEVISMDEVPEYFNLFLQKDIGQKVL